MFDPDFKTEGTYSPDQLIAGDHPLRFAGVTIITGQDLTRGAVLGKITASGKYTLCDPGMGSPDGSQVPRGILVVDTDATDADKVAEMYTAGDFNTNEITLGGSATAADVRETLRDRSIYLHDAVKA